MRTGAFSKRAVLPGPSSRRAAAAPLPRSVKVRLGRWTATGRRRFTGISSRPATAIGPKILDDLRNLLPLSESQLQRRNNIGHLKGERSALLPADLQQALLLRV